MSLLIWSNRSSADRGSGEVNRPQSAAHGAEVIVLDVQAPAQLATCWSPERLVASINRYAGRTFAVVTAPAFANLELPNYVRRIRVSVNPGTGVATRVELYSLEGGWNEGDPLPTPFRTHEDTARCEVLMDVAALSVSLLSRPPNEPASTPVEWPPQRTLSTPPASAPPPNVNRAAAPQLETRPFSMPQPNPYAYGWGFAAGGRWALGTAPGSSLGLAAHALLMNRHWGVRLGGGVSHNLVLFWPTASIATWEATGELSVCYLPLRALEACLMFGEVWLLAEASGYPVNHTLQLSTPLGGFQIATHKTLSPTTRFGVRTDLLVPVIPLSLNANLPDPERLWTMPPVLARVALEVVWR